MKNSAQTAIVLAGGMAGRMGTGCDKAFLKVNNEAIIDRQLKTLKQIFKEIIIVTNSPDSYKDIKGVTIVSDVVRDRGPIGGIYSGLIASSSFYNFVIACDMPFLNESVIRDIIENKNGYDVVVPKIDERCQPLFAVYSKDCISVIEKMLKRGDLKISNLFDKVKTLFISRTEMGKFDKQLSYLMNINTKDDLDMTA